MLQHLINTNKIQINIAVDLAFLTPLEMNGELELKCLLSYVALL